MFESAEVGNTVDKQTYKLEVPKVRAALLAAQAELAGSNFSVVVVVAGADGAGKSETANLLLKWMDPRGLRTHVLLEPTDEERQRPPMWRFWRALPPRGRMAIFFGLWDTNPAFDTVFNHLRRPQLDQALDRIIAFEQMLHHENTLLVKFWLHLSKAAQKRRLQKLEADPRQRWRVSKQVRKLFKNYDTVRRISEHVVRRTSTAEAPWTIIEATDKHYRNLTVAQTLLHALGNRLQQAKAEAARPAPAPVHLQPAPRNVLNQLDMTLALEPQEYKRELFKAQGAFNLLACRLRDQQRSLILVCEGPDAAGKGGAIRRLTEALDARDYQVISIAAPTDEERAHPYLWRFWRHLPLQGRITIYDRSWYGRVLVERVEGFCTPSDWQRAYGEINAFEEELTGFGIILVKCWLAITQEEQLRRFTERQATPYKQYKMTPEDWRNRERWDTYEAVACAMIEKTSTEVVPWTLVEANNKEWARIKVLHTVIRRLKEAVGG